MEESKSLFLTHANFGRSRLLQNLDKIRAEFEPQASECFQNEMRLFPTIPSEQVLLRCKITNINRNSMTPENIIKFTWVCKVWVEMGYFTQLSHSLQHLAELTRSYKRFSKKIKNITMSAILEDSLIMSKNLEIVEIDKNMKNLCTAMSTNFHFFNSFLSQTIFNGYKPHFYFIYIPVLCANDNLEQVFDLIKESKIVMNEVYWQRTGKIVLTYGLERTKKLTAVQLTEFSIHIESVIKVLGDCDPDNILDCFKCLQIMCEILSNINLSKCQEKLEVLGDVINEQNKLKQSTHKDVLEYAIKALQLLLNEKSNDPKSKEYIKIKSLVGTIEQQLLNT